MAKIGMGDMSTSLWDILRNSKREISEKMKGGKTKMEIKSRYEVIADLEEKKRDLIMERDTLGSDLKDKERELKMIKRNTEDKEEEIKEFKESMDAKKLTIEELIKSVDESLERLAKVSKTK